MKLEAHLLTVRSCTIHDAQDILNSGAGCLVDVRESRELLTGRIPGAITVPLSRIAQGTELTMLPRDATLVLICASGIRSRTAAEVLIKAGYLDVASVDGGIQAWQQAGLPLDFDGRHPQWLDRHSRQIKLPDVGGAGQEKLAAATVLVVGAGGLGSPVAFYLAAAGVGCLRVVDDDRIERSNLQRQILHTDARIGMAKVESAADTLRALNPDVVVDAIGTRLDADNLPVLLAGFDVVVDGSDNLATRHLLNRGCVTRGIPLVYGAVQGFEGQVSVFHPAASSEHLPCYHCLFPESDGATQIPNCAEMGVIGVVPGTIGLLQANEVIKQLIGIGTSLAGRLLMLDMLACDFRSLVVRANPACPVCQPKRNG